MFPGATVFSTYLNAGQLPPRETAGGHRRFVVSSHARLVVGGGGTVLYYVTYVAPKLNLRVVKRCAVRRLPSGRVDIDSCGLAMAGTVWSSFGLKSNFNPPPIPPPTPHLGETIGKTISNQTLILFLTLRVSQIFWPHPF